MSSTSTAATDVNRVTKKIAAGTDRLSRSIERNASDDRIATTAAELQDVVEETVDLLQTIDVGQLGEAIDRDALPTVIDASQVPAAIVHRDPDRALDFSHLRQVIDLPELWEAVDLLEFANEKRQLLKEIEDVVGTDGAANPLGDSEAVADLREFVDDVRPEATNAAIQREAREKAETARRAVRRQHAGLERVYATTANRSTGRRGGRSKNPTAVSLLPSGPLPDGVSTRVSTVPAAVRGAKIRPLPRVFGRRWRRADRSRSS